jgi:hypothetical protein
MGNVREPARLGERHTDRDACDTTGTLWFGCGGDLARCRVFQRGGEVRRVYNIKSHDTYDCPGNDNHVGCVWKRGFRGESEPAAPVSGAARVVHEDGSWPCGLRRGHEGV